MICPFCCGDVNVKQYVPRSMGYIHNAAGSDEAYALYRHLMLAGCWGVPVCPLCKLEFQYNPHQASMRMRFARHWCRYAGLTKQEHVIASAMGEE